MNFDKRAGKRVRKLLILQEYLCKVCGKHTNNGSYFEHENMLICGKCSLKL
jgi:transposase-like protein